MYGVLPPADSTTPGTSGRSPISLASEASAGAIGASAISPAPAGDGFAAVDSCALASKLFFCISGLLCDGANHMEAEPRLQCIFFITPVKNQFSETRLSAKLSVSSRYVPVAGRPHRRPADN